MRWLLPFLILFSALAISGCSHSGVSIAGNWTAMRGKAVLKLTADPNGAFLLDDGSSQTKGRWQSDGNEITLFRDISMTGGTGFGDGDDNAKYTVSPDGKTLSAALKDANGQLVFKKQ